MSASFSEVCLELFGVIGNTQETYSPCQFETRMSCGWSVILRSPKVVTALQRKYSRGFREGEFDAIAVESSV
jgi:hypothetical protein